MKIQFHLPKQGYKAEITQANDEGDFSGWIDRKFGNRIREVISPDFTLTNDADSFTVDFTYADDGFEFLKLFGGRVVE